MAYGKNAETDISLFVLSATGNKLLFSLFVLSAIRYMLSISPAHPAHAETCAFPGSL
jgi:hypothetical protein